MIPINDRMLAKWLNKSNSNESSKRDVIFHRFFLSLTPNSGEEWRRSHEEWRALPRHNPMVRTLLKSSMKSYSRWDWCLEGTCSGEVTLNCGSFLVKILGVKIRKSNISNLLLCAWSFEINSRYPWPFLQWITGDEVIPVWSHTDARGEQKWKNTAGWRWGYWTNSNIGEINDKNWEFLV
jgi:hypothetical protein